MQPQGHYCRSIFARHGDYTRRRRDLCQQRTGDEQEAAETAVCFGKRQDKRRGRSYILPHYGAKMYKTFNSNFNSNIESKSIMMKYKSTYSNAKTFMGKDMEYRSKGWIRLDLVRGALKSEGGEGTGSCDAKRRKVPGTYSADHIKDI